MTDLIMTLANVIIYCSSLFMSLPSPWKNDTPHCALCYAESGGKVSFLNSCNRGLYQSVAIRRQSHLII